MFCLLLANLLNMVAEIALQSLMIDQFGPSIEEPTTVEISDKLTCMIRLLGRAFEKLGQTTHIINDSIKNHHREVQHSIEAFIETTVMNSVAETIDGHKQEIEQVFASLGW